MAAPKGRPKPEGSGRPKGQSNKVTAELKDMIRGALDDVGGQAYLAHQAFENPVAFMTLVGKILPKDIIATVNGTMAHKVIFETIPGTRGSKDTTDGTAN